MTGSPHIPVMLREVVDGLAPRDGATYVDGTFGAGGYSRAILNSAACRVYGIDQDPRAVARGRAMQAEFPDRLTIIEGRFGSMDQLLAEQGIENVEGIALDIGVSSMQLDEAERGFSFAKDGPLDMRMGQSGKNAADIVNNADEAELADIIHELGEERYARRVARAIVEARKETPFSRTSELARVVRRAVPKSKDGIDQATRTFQALRIHVNDELGELDRGLAAAERLLSPGGRLAVVSFHSLEDRAVKNFLRMRSGQATRPSRHLPALDAPPPTFTLLQRKPVEPGSDEIARNPRARSARLRLAERTSAPAPRTGGPS